MFQILQRGIARPRVEERRGVVIGREFAPEGGFNLVEKVLEKLCRRARIADDMHKKIKEVVVIARVNPFEDLTATCLIFGLFPIAREGR